MNDKLDRKFVEKLQRLSAADRQEQVIEELLTLSYEINDKEYIKKVLHVSAQLSRVKQLTIQGTESIDNILRLKNKVSLSILDLIDLIPIHDDILNKIKSLLGFSANKLKKNIFLLFMFQKIIVLGFIYFGWIVRAMTNEEFVSVIMTSLILLTVFTSIFLNDLINTRILQKDDIRVNKNFARMSFLVVIVYLIISIIIVHSKFTGDITPSQSIILLGFIECTFGAYLGGLLVKVYHAPPQKAVKIES